MSGSRQDLDTWEIAPTDEKGAVDPRSPSVFGRYEPLELLGRGGMGEVWRVHDPDLGRTVALKVLHPSRSESWTEDLRLEDEARLGSQLQHPGVVPVYERGRLPDGRPYFTMQEIRGRTLKAHIEATYAQGAPDAWPVRRLIDAFHRVCETLAYAHSLHVIHRDLKAQNILLGAFGEVLVADWGLARQIQGPVGASPTPPLSSLRGDAQLTEAGSLAGTPSAMAPEQALGSAEALRPTADVYSLGAILFEILTGYPAFSGNVSKVLEDVIAGRRRPWPPDLGPTADLRDVVDRAMALDPRRRYPDAGALAAEIGRWLEGARGRERALGLVEQADEGFREAARRRAEAERARTQAATLAEALSPRDPVERKAPAWALQDAALEHEDAARLAEAGAVQLLHSSLNLAADLPEAHDRLADWYHARQAEAEARRDAVSAAEAGIRLAAHDRGRYAAWRRGDGCVTLLTDPPGAEVDIDRYERDRRRLVPVHRERIGPTPIVEHPLPMGSYRLRIRAPGHQEVIYPVFIGRGERWHGVPPGAQAPEPVWLPPEGLLGPEEVYIPGGWFQAGGDPGCTSSLPRMQVWVDSFVLSRFELRCGEYIQYLNMLVDAGREEEAERAAPRERALKQGELGSHLFGRDEQGHFFPTRDDTGDLWTDDMPLILVDLPSIYGYAAWRGQRDGRPWRPMGELEYEKAARGVDGRVFPWGDHLDPTWANMGESLRAPQPSPVHDFPDDRSPYDVRGLAGNVMEWTASLWGDGARWANARVPPPEAPDAEAFIVSRGGGYYGGAQLSRSAQRFRVIPSNRSQALGVRLAWSINALRQC